VRALQGGFDFDKPAAQQAAIELLKNI